MGQQMSGIRLGLLIVASMSAMAAPAFAGCGAVASGKSADNPAAASCSASGQSMTQLASALSGDDKPMSAMLSQGPIYPANNGSGRYICTPSGFGHIATCSLRSTN